ncbi:hypothetical protein AB0J21_12230 [Streptomyces sp. NPDC049954]|uniref:hypothetical protein n=1 Tax=Streptomyces sp. NPDC049954 TaxID=3155779 RepID=UPI003445C546
MNIDWAALGSVFGVSLGITVALVGAFALGIAGLSRASQTRRATATGTAPAAAAPAGGTGGGAPALLRTGAFACFALCLAAVAYGIYVIVA